MESASDSEASWTKFLNPESLKQNLLQGGLYLAAFEMLKDSLVGRPKDFFCFGVSEGEFVSDLSSPSYESEVRSLHKHPFTASALWWHKQGALSDLDLDFLRQIREHRDQIAHNMPKMIGSVKHSINLDLLTHTNSILAKIDNWWLQNIEAAIAPEQYERFTQEELKAASSMSSVFLAMMIPLVAGDDSQFRSLYTMWCERQKQKGEAVANAPH
ncbi:hypothetical protein [Prosthecobacter vanneervenii]|uniref:Uncharacterized protein n=1 Tax=Prosthecobacter vanneervenii TaxID=48466 RepID=A0A7W7Y8S3_9BACT|nr:hypothetical protein [Prosthecobacter vanneervenii]MBB5031629.1 hypothetical protein [Prosthecobacter vanneervenii]